MCTQRLKLVVLMCHVSCVQSFAKGVDMEDLGVRDAAAMSHGPDAPTDLPDDITMPAWLKDHVKLKVCLAS